MTWQTKWKRCIGVLMVSAAVLGVTGCAAPLVVGAAFAGGVSAAADRRTLGAQAEDRTIMLKGESRIANLIGDQGHVNVTSYNRKVLLTGEVKDAAMKEEVGRLATKIENVQTVTNELEVTFVSSVGSRANDSYITSKVVASFLDSKDIHNTAIKVVTERGNVYLMGLVTYQEGERAATLASHVSGVARVVKVFDYITEEERQRHVRQPGPQAGSAGPAGSTTTPAAADTSPRPWEPAPTPAETSPVRP